MPSWQGKSKGTTLGYSIFVGILKRFGVMPAYFLLRFVTVYYFLFSYKTSKYIFDFFHRRIGYGKFKSLFRIYTNYYQLGQTVIDKVVIMSGMPNRLSFDFDGEDHLREMVRLQRGGLLLGAHIGNWEIAGHLLERLETTINIVMFDGEHQQIKEYLERVTGKKNAKIIVIKDDLSHIYEINEAFKNKELVCIHADRFLEGNKTMTTDFLGAKALFPAGPFILAASFNVPVSFVFAMKESNLHYHFFASPVKIYDRTEKKANLQLILDSFSTEMEKKVKQYPEQWYNYYNFWQASSGEVKKNE
ncbi:MAG: lipid A biosynthesis acyltransferase [Bacteroidetes bacterium]|nr:lipid A biosynthesis acyltransferase [Bacteroidota bacterium]